MRRLKTSMAVTGMVAVLGMTAPGPALAWGPEGHDIIAAVALSRLSPAMQAKFQNLVDAGGGLVVDYMDKGKPAHCEVKNGSPNDLANWADCVRYGGEFAYTYQNHFDDIPHCPKPPAPPPLKISYCDPNAHPATPCGTLTLPQWITKFETSKGRDQAVALAMIVHIVGDLHQPLHTINNNDQGGNGIAVAESYTGSAGFASNLHKVWDAEIIRHSVDGAGQEITVATTAAAAKAGAPSWTGGTFDSWAAATHGIAVKAYDGLSPAVACGTLDHPARTVDQAYLDRFNGDVQQQLAIASVRLADILAKELPKVKDPGKPKVKTHA